MDHPTFQPGEWLVQTKLHPPRIRPETLHRPHLESTLRAAVTGYPLTLVSAPAGSGKTTVLIALQRLVPEYPLAWFALDEEDDDSTRFLATLTRALQRLHPKLGRSVWPLLQGGVTTDPVSRDRRVVGALIHDVLELMEAPFILVLDDLHTISDPGVYLALEYLLTHLPPQMHVVIGTRYDPPLPLARLAARRQMVELRRHDLAFSAEEAQELLNEVLGLSLSSVEVESLLSHTEGWAVGLCLLASSLQGGAAPERRLQFLAGVSQSERYVFDFLAEEVLKAQAPEVREFLLQTSILTELTPRLCRAVTGRADALDLLEELYRRNLFLVATQPEGAEVSAYRYHALFARFLERQLARRSPELLPELHRRAALAQQTPGRAITHYFAAELWEEAAQVMEQVGPDLLSRGMSETFIAWYNTLPEAVQRAHPLLVLLCARSLIHAGDYAGSRAYLELARDLFVAAGDQRGEGAALCSLITLGVQFGEFDQVRALAPQVERLPLTGQNQVMLHMSRAWLHLFDQEWAQVCAEVEAAMAVTLAHRDRLAGISFVAYISPLLAAAPGLAPGLERFCLEAAGQIPPESQVRMGLDEILSYTLLWQGKVEGALERAEAANRQRERMGGYPIIGTDVAATLTILKEREPAEVERYVKLTLERGEGGAPLFQLPFWLLTASRALALQGSLAEARQLGERLQRMTTLFPFEPYVKAYLAGLLALVERNLPAAEPHLQEAAKLDEGLPVATAIGSGRLLLARLRLDQGRTAEALALFSGALATFESEGTPGRILLEGPLVAPLLRLAAAKGDQRAARLLPLLGEESPAATAAPAAQPTALEALLTPREIDVLVLIVAGATNREIAEKLFVSEQTVKTHVVHILRKLDVTSRTQAAIRGRELGL